MEWRKRHHWRRRKGRLPYSLAHRFSPAILKRRDSTEDHYASFTKSGRRPKINAFSRAAFHLNTIIVAICFIILVNRLAAADVSTVRNVENITTTTIAPTTLTSNVTVLSTISLDEIYSTSSNASYVETTDNYFLNVSESITADVSTASTMTTGGSNGSAAGTSSNTHSVGYSTTVIPLSTTETPFVLSSLTTLISAIPTSTVESSKNGDSLINNGTEEFVSSSTPAESSTTPSQNYSETETLSVASYTGTAATSDIPVTETSTPLSVTRTGEETITTIVLHLNATAAVEFLEPTVRLVGRPATTALQVIAPPEWANSTLEQDSKGNSTAPQRVDNLSTTPASSTETYTKVEEGERSKSDKFSLKNNKLKNKKKPTVETDDPPRTTTTATTTTQSGSTTTKTTTTTTTTFGNESSTTGTAAVKSRHNTEGNTTLSSTTPVTSMPTDSHSPNPNPRPNKRVRPKKGRKQPQPVEMLFEINNMADLREYKSQLIELVSRVDKALDIQKSADLRNNFVPIQATHPDQLSAQFLRRVGAALNVSPNVDEKDELDRRLAPKNQPFTQPDQLERPSQPFNDADVSGDVASVPRRTPQQPLSSGGGSGYATAEGEGESETDENYKKLESMLMTAVLSLVTSASERRFMPVKNHTADECKRFSQSELVSELKQHGTYNPDLMAWDVSGVFRFLDRSISDQYERQSKSHTSTELSVRRNIEALERLLTELNLQCNVSSPEVIARLSNLTLAEPRRSIISPSIRMTDDEIRYKRNIIVAEDLMQSFNRSRRRDDFGFLKKQRVVGEVHLVPFGCDKRGGEEDGYLRLCSACQAVRRLPDEYFPPFINEVVCDEDKACLYFYDYPHGKCKQKHMNFVVLKNMGTQECQVWQKVNLNVRVSCECFVDEMSFFAKYV